MSRTRRLAVVGTLYLIYVAVAAGFASKYKSLYENDSNNFFFTTQIETTQKKEQQKGIDSSEAELREQRRALEARHRIDQVLKTLGRLELSRDPKYKWLIGRLVTDNVIFEFQFDPEWQAVRQCVVLRIFTRQGSGSPPPFEETICADQFAGRSFYESQAELERPEIASAILHAADHNIRRELTRVDERLRSLTTQRNELAQGPTWTWFDFFYFSVTSIVGGGYGDILPNSSRVRSIVVVQFLVSVLIAGFALAAALD